MNAHAATASEKPKRGTPPGQAIVPQPHGGAIGMPPHVPTEESRAKVKSLAGRFPMNGERHIAVLMGLSRDTLRKYYKAELELGRAEVLAAIAGQMVSRALDADAVGADKTKVAKGDIDAQKFLLARLGGFSTKVEHSGPDGGPIETRTFDLANLSTEQLEAMLPVIDQLLSNAQAEDGEFEPVEEGGSDATPDAE